MLSAIKHNLKNLTNFEGRDRRSTFWWYVLFLVILNFVIGLAVSIPLYTAMLGAAFETVQAGGDPEAVNAAMSASLGDQMRFITYAGGALTFILIGLFSASFVRRLHDSGKSGWWLALALAPVIYTTVMSSLNVDAVVEMARSAMNQSDPDKAFGDQTRLYFSSIVGWAGYLVTIIFGVLESDDGPNRFGEEPEVLT
uniref:DUF805 domain-containing protein n=1 Tax=Parerythrobacter lutipelagi TaxID=1964208 RepID=UPI001375D8F0|nr:DUF805 domain-containing protein [Parerythrobacter lutipelagi]